LKKLNNLLLFETIPTNREILKLYPLVMTNLKSMNIATTRNDFGCSIRYQWYDKIEKKWKINPHYYRSIGDLPRL
jgi:hypothetical protein